MEDTELILERIQTLRELDADSELREFINNLNISDVAELINEYPEDCISFFQILDIHLQY